MNGENFAATCMVPRARKIELSKATISRISNFVMARSYAEPLDADPILTMCGGRAFGQFRKKCIPE
jgi:hypothetical protein